MVKRSASEAKVTTASEETLLEADSTKITDESLAIDLDNAEVSDEAEQDEEELDLSLQIYYLNARPKNAGDGDLKVMHWSELSPKSLHHTSENLDTIKDDKRILSPLYDVRFYSLLNGNDESRQYVEIKLDKNFVLNKVCNLLNAYCNNDEEIDTLVAESKDVAGKIKIQMLQNELTALAKNSGMSKEELLKLLAAG
jgi:hypothetical protein